MTRRRSIRDEPPLPDDAVLVRALYDTYPGGRDFDRAALMTDAAANFEVFGYYGLSLWAVGDTWPMVRVLAEKCGRARRVALLSARELRGLGLGLVASGRRPHFDVHVGDVAGQHACAVQVTADGLDDLIDRFLLASYTVMRNPQFGPDET